MGFSVYFMLLSFVRWKQGAKVPVRARLGDTAVTDLCQGFLF